LLYRSLKIAVTLARTIFCRRIIINKPGLLKEQGPLILACNHPNSFLDAIMLDSLFEQPLWSLTRGDMFKNRLARRLLTSLKMLPVYRTREGPEYLQENYKTFDECLSIFRNNGSVVIFCEGESINNWQLRPIRKGTARLTVLCNQENIPVKILPVGINYSSYRRFGKNVFINFGNVLTYPDLGLNGSDGLKHQAFNNKLKEELNRLVYDIPKKDKKQQEEKLAVSVPVYKKILFALPAAIGWLLHAPLYLPAKRYTKNLTRNNDHFDSVLVAILFFLYPLYILSLSLVLFFITKSWLSFSLFVFLPLCAWAYVQIKPQLDK
jgi:1-acyl-sn-glycerol-3-phosphate acyltransferase